MKSKLLAIAISGLVLAGCSTFNKGIDYKTTSNARVTPLEVPPDLTAPSVDDRYSLPDARPGSATYSTYNRAAPAPSSVGVLPANSNASIERGPDGRFLKVTLDADKVWPIVKDWFTEMGFVIRIDNQAAGIMETEWAENRARIPLDAVRNLVGKVIDGMYSTPERDKFRVRLERAANGVTEIYLSHRGVQEIYVSEGKDQTKWQPRPTDKELEAEMLNRLMLKFGGDAATRVPTTTASAAGSSAAASGAAAGVTVEESGTRLRIADGFDRAWRRVGLALDRGGFTVEDRDRSKGLFFVRYIDPEFDTDSGDKKGIIDKLAFWRSPPKPGDRPAYRIVVAGAGEATTVQVQNPKGEQDTTATGKRMLTVLADQMK